jgi:iron(III) transport system permease protein
VRRPWKRLIKRNKIIREWLDPGRIWSIVAGVAIFYFLIWPMAMLVMGAFRTTPFGTDGTGWTLSGVRTVLTDPWTPRVILASVVHSTASTLLALVIALYFVMVTTRMETRLRWLVGPMMIVLLATPRLFYALSWAMLGNPNAGIFAGISKVLIGTGLPGWLSVYSWLGLIGVTSLKLAGFAYLLLYGPAMRTDRSMEDAAVMAGVPRFRAFCDITLTSLTPSLLAVGMFMFVENLRLFDIPAVIGLPAGIHTLPLRVNDYLLENIRANWSAAGALSLFVMLVIAMLVYVQTAIIGDRDFTTISGKATPPVPTPIGRMGKWVDLSIAAFIIFAIVLPITQVVIGSFQPYFGLYSVYTLNNYASILFNEDMRRIMVVTFLIAINGALIAVAASFGMALLMQRRRGTFLARMARLGSWVPIFAPGIVLSLALLWAYLYTPLIWRLYGTPWLMLFALIVGSIPPAVRAVEGIVYQVGKDVEEAARVCGASTLLAIGQITARLCLPSLLVAWLVITLGISGTLDIPLLFKSIEAQTVATTAYDLYNFGQAPEAAALFIIYLVSGIVGVGTVVLLGWLTRRELLRRVRIKQAALAASGGLSVVR